MIVKYIVRVICMGMASRPHEFDSEAEADKFAAEMRRIPGMVPIVESVEP